MDWNTIELIDIEEEAELEFDTSKYLQENFDDPTSSHTDWCHDHEIEQPTYRFKSISKDFNTMLMSSKLRLETKIEYLNIYTEIN